MPCRGDARPAGRRTWAAARVPGTVGKARRRGVARENKRREDRMKTEKVSVEAGKAAANFNLLYPPGISLKGQNIFLELSPAAAHDLRLDDLIAAFTLDRGQQREIQNLFSRLPRDPQVISYRQAILDDLLANPELAERFTSLLPLIDSVSHSPTGYHSNREMTWLHEVVERAGQLQNLIDSYEGMRETLRSV